MKPELLGDFLAWKAPNIPNIITGGLLPAGQVMFIYGEYGSWKSWLVMELAHSISEGRNWLVFGTNSSKVLIINSEITKASYQERWNNYVSARSISPNGNLLVDTDMELGLDTSGSLSELMNWVVVYNIKVIILDNLYSSTIGDLNKNTDASIFIRNCKALAALGVAVVVVHHTHQPIYDQVHGEFINLRGYEMFGSSYLTNWADTILEVKNVSIPGYNDTIKITPQKHRLTKLIPLTTMYQFSRREVRFRLIM